MIKVCVYGLFVVALVANCGCRRIEYKSSPAGEEPEPVVNVPYAYCARTVEGPGGWKVSFDGDMRTTLENDGTVSISNRGSRDHGIVIVEGKGTFTIRNCNLVHVKGEATVRAYDCNLVRVESGATVDGYDCREIAYYRGATVNPHGTTKVATMRYRIRTLLDN